MRKYTFIIIAFLFIPTSKLLSQSFTFTSKYSYDSLWVKVINYLIDKRLDVNLTDKTTGSIVIKDVVLTYTTENQKSEFYNPNAALIVNEIKYQGKKFPEPAAGYGAYNTNKETYENPIYSYCLLKIKSSGASCQVQIEIYGLYYFKSLYTSSNTDKKNRNNLIEFKSTGKFEKALFESIEN